MSNVSVTYKVSSLKWKYDVRFYSFQRKSIGDVRVASFKMELFITAFIQKYPTEDVMDISASNLIVWSYRSAMKNNKSVKE